MDLNNYLTTKQAAAICGVDESHIRRLLKSGQLKGIAPTENPIGAWLVSRASVEKFERHPTMGRPKIDATRT